MAVPSQAQVVWCPRSRLACNLAYDRLGFLLGGREVQWKAPRKEKPVFKPPMLLEVDVLLVWEREGTLLLIVAGTFLFCASFHEGRYREGDARRPSKE